LDYLVCLVFGFWFLVFGSSTASWALLHVVSASLPLGVLLGRVCALHTIFDTPIKILQIFLGSSFGYFFILHSSCFFLVLLVLLLLLGSLGSSPSSWFFLVLLSVGLCVVGTQSLTPPSKIFSFS